MDVGFNGQRAAERWIHQRGCSIFIPTVIEFPRPDSSHGFSVSPMGLTMFPPNEDGDNHGGQQDFAEQERNQIAVLPQPGGGPSETAEIHDGSFGGLMIYRSPMS